MIVGFLAKYDFAKAAQLGMATGAVMKIMPKMVAMFMEGLMPIAEAAKEFANKRLGGRSVNIGMDAASNCWTFYSYEYKLINGTNFFSISDHLTRKPDLTIRRSCILCIWNLSNDPNF